MIIKFFIPMKRIPTKTYQEKRLGVTRSGRAYLYEDSELKTIRERFAAELAKHVPQKPLDGPVALLVDWCFPITGKHYKGEWKTSKPDTDNLLKLFKDCMTSVGFFKDDAQVVREISEKFYNDLTGVFVKLEQLPQPIPPVNPCLYCGEEVPEGAHVCPNCEKDLTKGAEKNESVNCM